MGYIYVALPRAWGRGLKHRQRGWTQATDGVAPRTGRGLKQGRI